MKPIVINNVDIELLKRQRNVLIQLCTGHGLNKDKVGALNGLINFIDYISDVAEGHDVLSADPDAWRDNTFYRKFAKSMTGTKCGICGDTQFNTPSGVTCGNGHGGAETKEE